MRLFLEEAKRAVRMNSVTAHGNEELANYYQSLLQSRGFKTSLQQVSHSNEEYSKRQFNVIGILGDPLVDRKTRKGILLCSHLDTNSPGIHENWTQNDSKPFEAVFRDGYICGLGAASGKLDFLAKMHAAEKFREKKIKQPIYIVGTCGAESGMFGAQYLIKSLALNPKFVLLGEATGLRLVAEHKSQLILRMSLSYQMTERDARGFNRRLNLFTRGQQAHGAEPETGLNAISLMCQLLQSAVENGFELRLTKLGGGETYDSVPDQASAEVYLTSHQFEDFKPFFRSFVREEGLEKNFRAELGGLGDVGVRFLPDPVFSCVGEIASFFERFHQEYLSQEVSQMTPSCSTVSLNRLTQRPGQVDLYYNIHLIPDFSGDLIESKVKEGIEEIAKKFPSLNLATHRFRYIPPFRLPAQAEWKSICSEALKDTGIEPIYSAQSISTEAAMFQHAGFDTLVFGAGDGTRNRHTTQEKVLYKDLEKSAAFYANLIERVCL